MATKDLVLRSSVGAKQDPHVSLIDAYERMAKIKAMVKAQVAEVRRRAGTRDLTAEEQKELQAYARRVADAVRWVQEDLFDELMSHGLEP